MTNIPVKQPVIKTTARRVRAATRLRGNGRTADARRGPEPLHLHRRRSTRPHGRTSRTRIKLAARPQAPAPHVLDIPVQPNTILAEHAGRTAFHRPGVQAGVAVLAPSWSDSFLGNGSALRLRRARTASAGFCLHARRGDSPPGGSVNNSVAFVSEFAAFKWQPLQDLLLGVSPALVLRNLEAGHVVLCYDVCVPGRRAALALRIRIDTSRDPSMLIKCGAGGRASVARLVWRGAR